MIRPMGEDLIHFADVVIDPRRRELRRGGELVPVQPKVFDLILHLVTHRDRAVSKDELQDAVWPGVIVTETALTRAIMKARRAIGDDSEQQAMIRTVHGRGYRFVALLDEVADAPVEAAASQPISTASRTVTRRPAWTAVGIVVLLALAGVAALFLVRSETDTALRIAVLPVDDRTSDLDLAWTSLGLMSYANRLIAESINSETISARRMMSAQEELPESPAIDDLQSLRRTLDATHLVHGSLTRDGDDLALAYRIVHERGASPVTSVRGRNPTRLAQEMARSITSGLPGGGTRREFRTVSDDDFVNEAYARGLALNLQGEVGSARTYFEVAVRQQPELFWPRYELALTMRDMGELDASLAVLIELAAHEQTQLDPEMAAAANNALAQIYWRRQNYVGADAAYEVALAAARQSDKPAHEAVILVNRGILARNTRDYTAARAFLAEALAIHARIGDNDVGAIFHSLGQIEVNDGKLPLARDYFERARAAFDAVGDRRRMSASINELARISRRQGRFVEAEEGMLEALAMREALDDYFGRVHSHQSLAALYADIERWAPATEHAEKAIALAEASSYTSGLQEALETRARIALARDDLAAARSVLERLATDFPDSPNSIQQRMLQARLWAAEGRVGDAAEALQALVKETPILVQIDALLALGELSRERNAAYRHWERALALAESEHEYVRIGRVWLARAQRAIADGDPDTAASDIENLQTRFPEWPATAALQEQIGQERDLAAQSPEPFIAK